MNNLTYEMRDKYLFVKITTELDVKTIKTYFQSFLENAKKNDIKLALFDVSKSQLNIDVMGRFFAGEFIAEKGRFLKKIACILNEKHFNRKFMENVIVNRGLSTLATTSEEEAIEWLLK